MEIIVGKGYHYFQDIAPPWVITPCVVTSINDNEYSVYIADHKGIKHEILNSADFKAHYRATNTHPEQLEVPVHRLGDASGQPTGTLPARILSPLPENKIWEQLSLEFDK